jgi:predicted O-methyltransferase YrrM
MAMDFIRPIATTFDVSEDAVKSIAQSGKVYAEHAKDALAGRNLWAIDEDERLALYCVTRLVNPTCAVETGVGSGVSSSMILGALKDSGSKGQLHSIDKGEKYGNESRSYPVGYIVPEELRTIWSLHIGNSKVELPALLHKVKNIQMFLHDSEHTHEHVTFELNEARMHLSEGVIVIDNYTWTNAPEEFARRIGSKVVHLTGDMALIPLTLARNNLHR